MNLNSDLVLAINLPVFQFAPFIFTLIFKHSVIKMCSAKSVFGFKKSHFLCEKKTQNSQNPKRKPIFKKNLKSELRGPVLTDFILMHKRFSY